MENCELFKAEGKWYKGNLHTHSTISDGKRDPEAVAEYYRDSGWDFLSITDHRIYGYHKELCHRDFLLLPGMEMDIWNDELKHHNHLVGIRKECHADNYQDLVKVEPPKWEGPMSVQQGIDALNRAGNLAFYCHPVWSRVELEEMLGLQGLIGMEVYNHGCFVESNTGNAEIYWDSLLRRKRKVYGFATDDAHFVLNDACGGWICVKAPELTEEAIVKSILEGRFYASSGPTIYDYGLKDGAVYIQTSPVREIHFITWEPHGRSFFAENGSSLEEAHYQLKGKETFVRVEIVGFDGRKAWSNPIFPDFSDDIEG
jgi:hypothetical protein